MAIVSDINLIYFDRKNGVLPKTANLVKDYLLSKKLLSLKMAQKRAETSVMYV